MPVLPKDDTEGIRTRSQRMQEIDQRRFEDSPRQTPGGTQLTTEPVPGVSGVPAASANMDFSALMAMLHEQARQQEEQARRQEEQARRQEEHVRWLQEHFQRVREESARRFEEHLQRVREIQACRQDEQAHRQEEQARRQDEQAHRQEEQARRQEEPAHQLQEQLQRYKEEQARRDDEQILLMKDLLASFGKDIKAVKETVQLQENRISGAEIQIADVRKALINLKAGEGSATAVVAAPSVRGFKLPPFDGTSSWSAYKIQFEAVMKANGWTKEQAMTALTLGLRDKALTVLEALGKNVTYEQLLEALESRYGDAHLEHAFRAQLKDRVQRGGENLQQWALEIETLVRKAYQSAPELVERILTQAFIDGIRDLEVRATVRLGHHETLKDALAHALEVEAVRCDHRAHRIREVAASPIRDRAKYSPRCYTCGEKGHLRSSCPKRSTAGEVNTQERRAADVTAQQQGNE